MPIEWRHRHGANEPPPSSVHGWLTYLRGFFGLSHTLRRQGSREIHDAQSYRSYVKDKAQRRRHRDHHHITRVTGRNEHVRIDSERDGGSQPWMHPPYRCRPWYHGDHHRFLGWITGRSHHLERGAMMREVADKERRSERRRRQRQARDEAYALRFGIEAFRAAKARQRRRAHHREQM